MITKLLDWLNKKNEYLFTGLREINMKIEGYKKYKISGVTYYIPEEMKVMKNEIKNI